MTCEVQGHTHPAERVVSYGRTTVYVAAECAAAIMRKMSDPQSMRIKSLFLANKEFLYNAFNKGGCAEVPYTTPIK
jgi:hypothetical protein